MRKSSGSVFVLFLLLYAFPDLSAVAQAVPPVSGPVCVPVPGMPCPGSQVSSGGSSRYSSNAALKQQLAGSIAEAFVQFLLSGPDPKADAQKKQMMEELERRKAEALRQHNIQEAARLEAICDRLSATLKLSGLPDLKLKDVDPGRLQLKLGEDDDSRVGVRGLPGIALNDDTGNGGNTPYGIQGLPGIYTNGPGSGSTLTESKLQLKIGEESETPQAQTAPDSVSANAVPTNGDAIPPSLAGGIPDPRNMTPQQLADAATLVSKLPPEEQQRLMNAAAANSRAAGSVIPAPAVPSGASVQPGASRSQEVATGPTAGLASNVPPLPGTQAKIHDYKESGNGLVGGTTWIYGYNVPPGSQEAIRARAEEALSVQMKLAGVQAKDFISTKDYNFILGMAASHSATEDLWKRVVADGSSQGGRTVEQQSLYASLRDRKFERLDCHSNGAMICLAALTRQDAKAEHVRLFGPQITKESLAEWQKLIDEGRVKDVQLFINRGDPVPGLSYMGTHPTGVNKLVFSDSLQQEIQKDAPGIRVRLNDCPNRGYLLSLDCHDMKLYQENVDSQPR